MKNLSWTTAALLAAATITLGACGGGGGGGGDGIASGGGGFVDGTEVPGGVEQGINDVIAFARQLIAATSETSEPVLLGNAKLATSESDEPADL